MIKTVYQYIQFDLTEQDEKKKTQTYAVRNITCQWILGYVEWCPGWRQYCFASIDPTNIFSEGCLKDICDFIKQLMIERKNEKH